VTATRLAFDVAAGAAVLFAGIMVVHRNPLKGLLATVVSFFALAVAFVLLSAPFLAVLQVIVYAGAILVLFLFVTMLLNPDDESSTQDPRKIQRFLALLAIVFVVGVVVSAIRGSGAAVASSGLPPATGEVAPLARALFSDAALPFEAVSVLLLASLVGAFLLTRREGK
jgi:NADH-quinone oxidoreductase subunit J